MKYRRKDVVRFVEKLEAALDYLNNDFDNGLALSVTAARAALEEFKKSASTDTLHSSLRQDWMTPNWLVDLVHACFGPSGVDLDPCATSSNNVRAKCFFTEQDDGLVQPWPPDATIYINPPYNMLRKPGWVDKIVDVASNGQNQMIVLVPARTDTQWYRRLFDVANHVTLLRGRVRFALPDGTLSNPAPFPSVLFGFGVLDWEPIRGLGITSPGGAWRTQ